MTEEERKKLQKVDTDQGKAAEEEKKESRLLHPEGFGKEKRGVWRK